MSTEFCRKCKQSHPGRECDYTDQGECIETVNEAPKDSRESSTPRDKSTSESHP